MAGRPIDTIHSQTSVGAPPGDYRSFFPGIDSAFHFAVYAGTLVPAQWQNGAPIVTSGFAPTPVIYHANPPPWQHGTSPVVQQGIGVASPVSGGTYHPSPVAQRADFPMNYSQYRSQYRYLNNDNGWQGGCTTHQGQQINISPPVWVLSSPARPRS